jgi:hypothetical protein
MVQVIEDSKKKEVRTVFYFSPHPEYTKFKNTREVANYLKDPMKRGRLVINQFTFKDKPQVRHHGRHR